MGRQRPGPADGPRSTSDRTSQLRLHLAFRGLEAARAQRSFCTHRCALRIRVRRTVSADLRRLPDVPTGRFVSLQRIRPTGGDHVREDRSHTGRGLRDCVVTPGRPRRQAGGLAMSLVGSGSLLKRTISSVLTRTRGFPGPHRPTTPSRPGSWAGRAAARNVARVAPGDSKGCRGRAAARLHRTTPREVGQARPRSRSDRLR
jgi:hypothetical protein